MAQKYPAPFGREKARKNGPLIVRGPWRRHPDLNRRIGDLQSPALPLGYGAVVGLFLQTPISACVGRRKSAPSETTSSQNESRLSFCIKGRLLRQPPNQRLVLSLLFSERNCRSVRKRRNIPVRRSLRGSPRRRSGKGVFRRWSGQRDSNSLPPPWQGGALPNELCPHGKAACGAFRTNTGRNRGFGRKGATPAKPYVLYHDMRICQVPNLIFRFILRCDIIERSH